MKNPTFKLKQNKDGRWECRTTVMGKGTTVGDSPNESVEKMQATLKDYKEFLDHNYGICGVDCTRCGGGSTKGEWKDLLPKGRP